jgi:hypothetical protein
MFRSALQSLALTTALALGVRGAGAQMHQHDMAGDQPGSCDLCAPHVSVDGAALFRARAALPSATSDQTTPLVRARLEIGSFIERVGLFSQMEFTPADGPTPGIQLGLKVRALPATRPVNVSAAAGITDYRQGVGDLTPGAFVVRGWGQLTAEYRTPLHEITLYGQAGVPFLSSARVAYQLGVSHPLAPYKLHLP